MEFGIYWMTPSGERELLVSDASISCNQPVLLSERERPFQRVDNVDYTKEEGVYYMQNIYEGNGLKGVQPGTIKTENCRTHLPGSQYRCCFRF